jgi:hypothetical protein
MREIKATVAKDRTIIELKVENAKWKKEAREMAELRLRNQYVNTTLKEGTDL